MESYNTIQKSGKEQIKSANEINNNAVGSTSHEIEEIVEEEEAENDTKNKKKQSVGSEDDPWSTSDESLENEENYVRELASIAAGRSASIAIAGISGSTHNAGGGGVYSTHVPTSQLSLMKEKAAAAAPISPLKHPMKAPLPPPSPSTKKSCDTSCFHAPVCCVVKSHNRSKLLKRSPSSANSGE